MSRSTLTVPLLFAWLAHVAAFTPLAQWGQTALLLNNTIYVYGGEGPSTDGLTSFFTLDVSIPWNITGPAWADRTSDAGTVTVPLVAYGTTFRAYDNQSFYIWGGGGTPGKTLLENGFAQYSLVTKQWSLPSSIANMPLQRRELSAAMSSSGVAYIWGGWGDTYTGFPTVSPYSYETIFNDMITFDTAKQIWKTLNVTGSVPIPRILHTLTMLPNDQLVVIGGLTGVPINATLVNLEYAPMSDIRVFDTKTAAWTSYNATGNLPQVRRASTAVLADDGISIIIIGGGTTIDTINLNDVAILNTVTMQWSQPSVSGNPPAGRMLASSVITNGQIILMLGFDNTNLGLSDVAVLDTRHSSYAWTSGFVPVDTASATTSIGSTSTATSSSSSSSSDLSAVGGIGGVVAIALGSVIIVATIVLLALFKPWQRRNNSKDPQAPSQSLAYPPPVPPAQYVDAYANMGVTGQQPQYTNVNPQYNNVNPPYAFNEQPGYGIPPPPPQHGAPGWPNQGGHNQPAFYPQQDYSQQPGNLMTQNSGSPLLPQHNVALASPNYEPPTYSPPGSKPNMNDNKPHFNGSN